VSAVNNNVVWVNETTSAPASCKHRLSLSQSDCTGIVGFQWHNSSCTFINQNSCGTLASTGTHYWVSSQGMCVELSQSTCLATYNTATTQSYYWSSTNLCLPKTRAPQSDCIDTVVGSDYFWQGTSCTKKIDATAAACTFADYTWFDRLSRCTKNTELASTCSAITNPTSNGKGVNQWDTTTKTCRLTCPTASNGLCQPLIQKVTIQQARTSAGVAIPLTTDDNTAALTVSSTMGFNRIIDLDGDTYPDLVSIIDSTLAVRFNDGKGKFGAQEQLSLGTKPTNADKVFFEPMDSKFGLSYIYFNGTTIHTSLFSGARSPSDAALTWLSSSASAAIPTTATSMVKDFNGDGQADIGILNGANFDLKKLKFATNTGLTSSGVTRVLGTTAPTWGSAKNTWAVDLDKDGFADILSINGDSIIMVQNNASGSTLSEFVPGFSTWGITATAPNRGLASLNQLWLDDFNGDGKVDIATISGSEQYIFTFNGFGTSPLWTKKEVFFSEDSAEWIFTGDASGDGAADMLRLSGSNLTVIYRLTSGAFQRNLSIPTASIPANSSGFLTSSINFTTNGSLSYAVDMNRDGVVDLVSVSSNEVRIIYMGF
jgi:hypothetical protein